MGQPVLTAYQLLDSPLVDWAWENKKKRKTLLTTTTTKKKKKKTLG
jgi:hypothetical protein